MQSTKHSKIPSTTVHGDLDSPERPTSLLYDYPKAKAPRPRRESQFEAVAHTMNKEVAGHAIRSWSVYFFLTLVIHCALYAGIAKQNLRQNLYQANTTLARVTILYVTFTALVVPSICRFFLKTLAASVAGHLLAENAYTAPSACFLLSTNFRMTPDMKQNQMFLRGAEKGVRGVIMIRFIGDYIVHFTIPFVALALLVRPGDNDSCWISFDWGWLLTVILWPALWSFVPLGYMIQYWQSPQCIRSGFSSQTSTILQAGTELMMVVKEKQENLPGSSSTKWRYGHRTSPNHDQNRSFLGLVREDECISLTELLLGMEYEDTVYPSGPMQDF